MRILWCTHSMAGFKAETGGYNGCGWITSLLKEFKNISNVEIGVTFYYHEPAKSVTRDGVSYFPIYQHHIGTFGKIKTFLGDYTAWKDAEKHHLDKLKKVVDNFKPDVIHVWGTETDMGLISSMVSIPVIVHLQGLLHPYLNALCPPGISERTLVLKDGLSPIQILKNLNGLHYWRYKADREIRIFKACKHYFGRTHWDKAISHLYAPEGSYHYCSEMLRKEFYASRAWSCPQNNVFQIISTISSPLYKGMDMVLKTAKILKDFGNLHFEWKIIGVSQARIQERLTGIRASEVNVEYLGVKTASEILSLEMNSHLYFHPSYIDNSPNSVCEAQLIGMPVLAVNVGGVSTILENGDMGYLVPSNEPDMAASLIVDLSKKRNLLIEKCELTRLKAMQRHKKDVIIQSLLKGYQAISLL